MQPDATATPVAEEYLPLVQFTHNDSESLPVTFDHVPALQGEQRPFSEAVWKNPGKQASQISAPASAILPGTQASQR